MLADSIPESEHPFPVQPGSRLRRYECPISGRLPPLSYCLYSQQLNVRDLAFFCRSLANRLRPDCHRSRHSWKEKSGPEAAFYDTKI
jgi:hypothetical protein